jgi:threonine-phosphate decarboxylase
MDPEAVDALSAGPARTDRSDRDRTGRIAHGGVEDPWLLDFSANTNPLVPDGTAGVYEAALSAARSYPADDYAGFRAAAAEVLDCEARAVIPTAGGMETIRLAAATAVEPGDRALVPAPSFGEYEREVRLQGAKPEFVPAADILGADPEEHAIAFVCQPNNPTGGAYDPDRLAAFADECREADTTLVVDEAFLGFTDMSSVAGRSGVLVARSLTKLFGLPGLRMGYAVATGPLRDRLEVARPTWGLSAPAAAVGAHCLGDREFVAATRERVRDERERLSERLSTRFEVLPSRAPFLLLDVGSHEAVDDLLSTVRDAGIAIRDARTFRGLDRHVRVAVRLPAENDQLLEALDV